MRRAVSLMRRAVSLTRRVGCSAAGVLPNYPTASEDFGTSGRYAIRHQEHWPPPEDYGYRKLHSDVRAANTSIRSAHAAFQILAARCSLAIAIWQFPGPLRGEIPDVLTLHYDCVSATVVPDWIPFLRQADVPQSWLDALSNSVITDFSINLRVGTVFVPSPECLWLPIATVLRAANVPVFVQWPGPTETEGCIAAHPYMKVFAPNADDVTLALGHRPGGQPRVVTLCRDSEIRPLPDYAGLDNSAPPFGPYQLPRESRIEFFVRRERYRADQMRQESMLQKERHLAREERAETGGPPSRRTRVYLWVRAGLVVPDLAHRWAQHEYRLPIPPAAFRSLWMVHPETLRRYNSFFDEWDLWFPPGWGQTDDLDLSTTRHLGQPPKTGNTSLATTALSGPPLADEHHLLNPSPDDRDSRTIDHADSFMLHSWYGIQVCDTKLFPDVDYNKFAQDIWHLFGETRDRFPTDEPFRKCLAGWASAVMARDWKSRALKFTWDLDARNPNYLLDGTATDPRLVVSLERLRSPDEIGDPDSAIRWVKMRYNQDPDDQKWSLLTIPMGALLLLRRTCEAKTSRDALHTLLCAGIPARTGTWIDLPPIQTTLSKPRLSHRRLQAPWRKKGERPTIQDYDAYYQRVLELCHSPHMHCAWLKGGIVWRIMSEVTAKHPQSDLGMPHMHDIMNRPSGLPDYYQAVTLNPGQGAYYNDSLGRAELDIIAGVVRVYTGYGDQTEDASWWPKHSIWVRVAGHTGIWSPADERWFQRRLKDILEGREGPLNAAEWKVKMKRQRKVGKIADALDNQSWEFIYRHVEGIAVPSLPMPFVTGT
ncbi:hypothetical protein GSI_05791 [Ganoderma sinense ZZ0214-1]|uniref:Uncharacterized protein n=1 Tax=Ganoderma sinense ZZ0214-1 TaxID=1077348 RepID=A0A2G8SBE8_9APHY|nr:hypothetical protein GSI_05791 [Ganoderma sinense ZZ0214-1]